MSGMLAREYGDEGKYAVGSEQWGAKLRRVAQKLSKEIEDSFMELAAILYMIYDTPVDGDRNNPPIYKQWGYENFDDCISGEFPDFSPQRARQLRTLHYRLNIELVDLPDHLRRRITGLGYSKARELVKVLTPSNAQQWIDTAERSNVVELQERVKRTREEMEKLAQTQALNGDDENLAFEPTDEKVHFATKNFKLALEQKTLVEHAIDRAKELSKSTKTGHNLTLICMDFLANNDFRLPNDAQLQARYLAKFEQLMGKKIVLVNPMTKEVEYGIEALQVLAGEKSS